MSKPTVSSLKEKLLQPGFKTPSPDVQRLSDPIADTPLVLTLDDVLPYDSNPRTTRNPKYAELKDSIRQRGLDSPPPVTRRPGEDKYRIRNGGNTRLAILNELYRETGDERFFRFNCLFRPWDQARGEIIALTGHLAENDLHGQLMFIERALGVEQARAIYEAESGGPLSQRELARRLSADGYPISNSHISRMQDTIRYLLPAAPALLYSGLGVDRISKILSLRKTASLCWERHLTEGHEPADFEQLFQDVLSLFEGEAEEFLFSRFQDELIDQMKRPLGLGYETILLEITQNQDQLRRATPVLELPPAPVSTPPAAPGVDASQAGDDRGQTGHRSNDGLETRDPSTSALATGETPAENPNGRPLPPDLDDMSEGERQARIDGHVASPVNLSPRIIEMKQRLAALDGEVLPDFNANALVAIPVQAGGLYPVSDLWYIEREIDSPATLRQQIAQMAREIAQSVGAPGEILEVDGGIGFSYRQPSEDAEVSGTALDTVTLLQSLSGATSIALKLLAEQPEPRDALGEFQFAAGLGQLLLGQPQAKGQSPDASGRLSDGELVKLFRIVRLARRLIDLEIQQMNDGVTAIDS